MYKRLKKNSQWSILELGSFEISNIKKEILSYDEEWFIDTSRQEKGSVHKYTNMFRICSTDYDWEPGTPVETIYSNKLSTISAQQELDSIFKQLEEYYSGTVIRCEFIRMKPFSNVDKHTDGGPILHYSRRIHIPIFTKKEVTFTVMNTEINMEEGNWYEINNQLPHSVSNPTDIKRIHLIIDILPNDMLNLRKKEDYVS